MSSDESNGRSAGLEAEMPRLEQEEIDVDERGLDRDRREAGIAEHSPQRRAIASSDDDIKSWQRRKQDAHGRADRSLQRNFDLPLTAPGEPLL